MAAMKSRRGFAAMDPAKQREIASKGGRAAHAKGTAHEFTADEARSAGRKGGMAVSRDRAHMAMIGQRGGERSHGGRGYAGRTPVQVSVNRRSTANVARKGGGRARAGGQARMAQAARITGRGR
jgi:general stress protein YciG